MIYSPMTSKAMALAYEAHHGQLDQSGVPYIFHPMHLAEQMDDEISCCVALLHDTVEDTYVTIQQIRRLFGDEVADAVALLTHEKETDYLQYVQAIGENPVARKVKLADLAHNADQSRLAGTDVSPERVAAWQAKYAAAWKVLTGKCPAWE